MYNMIYFSSYIKYYILYYHIISSKKIILKLIKYNKLVDIILTIKCSR